MRVRISGVWVLCFMKWSRRIHHSRARPRVTSSSRSLDQDPIPITQFAPEVPEALEWIIAEALTKDPDERCQTAKEMLGKLKRLKQRAEAGALPTSPSELNRSIPSHPAIGTATTLPPEGAPTLNETIRSTAGDLSDTKQSRVA